MSETFLVTPDTEFEAQVKRAFDGQIHATRWWDPSLPRLDPAQAVHDIAADFPGVVVLGPDFPTAAALAVAEQIDLLHPEICVVLVAKPTARLWEHALRAGVREIVPTGADDDVVRAALARAEAAASRRQASTAAAQRDEAPRGRVITVMSPKGGAGKTMVASNLTLSLANSAPGDVVIVDLDLQFGDVASALAVGPQSTMADAARADGKLDSTTLKVFLEPHPGGLYVLAGPHFPAEADEVSSATVGEVIDILAAEFAYIVIDTGAGLDEYTLAAAERSDDLVLVCVTDVPSVRGLRKALDALDLLGMTKAHRHLVLNRSDDRVGLATKDVESTLGLPIEASIPTTRAVPISINQGSPIVQSDRRSPAAKALIQLAGRLTGNPGLGGRGDPQPASMPNAEPDRSGHWFSRKDDQ
jgi:pilus assembly protein CpaE